MVKTDDLTILYYTANRAKESFALSVRQQLLKAAGEIPIISISQKPMDFGIQNICVGDKIYSSMNIYRQVLVGAKAATTKYVAMAEDDVLYSYDHFRTYIPKDDEFAYNFCRWAIYSWVTPAIYSFKNRRVLSVMICPRKLLIEALEERFAKYPDEASLKDQEIFSEFGKYEKNLEVTPRKAVDFKSVVPCIVFSHEDAIGFQVLGTKKRLGELRAYDIPVWGRAEDILRIFK
jgi:hypothetical protein